MYSDGNSYKKNKKSVVLEHNINTVIYGHPDSQGTMIDILPPNIDIIDPWHPTNLYIQWYNVSLLSQQAASDFWTPQQLSWRVFVTFVSVIKHVGELHGNGTSAQPSQQANNCLICNSNWARTCTTEVHALPTCTATSRSKSKLQTLSVQCSVFLETLPELVVLPLRMKMKELQECILI